jgi:hypothetical protein
MNGHRVRIEAVHARTEYDVIFEATDAPVPAARDSVRREPPQIVSEVRARKLWNSMPGYLRQIQIVHALAVDVDLKFFRQLRNPLHHPPLGSVPLVEER